MLTNFFEKILGLDKLDAGVTRAEAASRPAGIFARTQAAAGIEVDVTPADLARIPSTGPVIVVSNHPTGFSEGLVVPALLESVRNDGMAMAHSWLGRWPALASRMFLVNPQARGAGRAENIPAVRAAVRWLQSGKSFVMFPSARVARPRRPGLTPEELPWLPGLARLVRLTGATVVPLHVSGRSGRLHQFLAGTHPRLGTLALAREMNSHRDKTMTVRVGRPISAERFLAGGSPARVVDDCRELVLGLAEMRPLDGNPGPSPAPGFPDPVQSLT